MPAAEHDNVALVRRIYELHALGEIDEAMTHFAGDVEWIEPAENPEASTLKGPNEARHSHDEWSSAWGELDIKIVSLTPIEDRVLAHIALHVTGAGSGAPAEFEQFQIWTVRDGKIARMQMIYDKGEAKRAAGIETTTIEETK